jgi:hypothetical protein
MTHKEPHWHNLIFDATGVEEGKLLVGYDLIPLDLRSLFPLDKINIRPKTVEASLSMAVMGLREVVPSIELFPVNKVYCKFDISGDSRHPVKTNKHAVISGSCNVFEVITIDLEVPTDLQYAPTLTVYVYDNVFGIIGERLVGVANIPLRPYCKRILDQLNSVANILLDNNPLGAMRTMPQHTGTKWGELVSEGKFKHNLSSMHRRLTGDEEDVQENIIEAAPHNPREGFHSPPTRSIVVVAKGKRKPYNPFSEGGEANHPNQIELVDLSVGGKIELF